MKFRLEGRFWMARLLFLAVCAFLLASTVNIWVKHRIDVSLSSKKQDKKMVHPSGLSQVEKRDFVGSTERNIFSGRREKVLLAQDAPEGETGRWEDAAPSSLGARLVATAVFPFPQYSLASIESGGIVKTYSINECQETTINLDPLFLEILGPSVAEPLAPCNRLMDVAVVRRIEEERVVIFNERDRKYEYLALLDGFVPPQAQSRQMVSGIGVGSNVNAAALGSTIRKIGNGRYAIEAKDFDATMGNLSMIASQARLVPAFEDGKSIGFKLLNIVPDSVYSKIGLQDGDVISKINGYPINSPEKALELYQMRSTATQLNIDYKRGSSSNSTDISIEGR